MTWIEPLDRNKTDMTHRLTALAMWYLELRGFAPVETEVLVGDFGIVDVAGFCEPTPSETRKLRLRNQRRMGLDEFSYSEIMFQYGPLLTAVVEVKVGRQDYLKDRQRKFNLHPAHLCYLAYPKGLLSEDEIPPGWHGLEADKSCQQLRRKYWTYPEVQAQHPGDIVEFLAALAKRADYRTRFARHRTMTKMIRAGINRQRRETASAVTEKP